MRVLPLLFFLFGFPPFANAQSPLQNADSCSELPPGHSRIITRDAYPADSIMTIFPGYLLKRNADTADHLQSFEAIVKLKFKLDANEDADAITEMLGKAANCYNSLDRIERNGQALRIRLAQENESAPENEINLSTQAMGRKNSEHWTTQMTCAEVLHETFHLLGLVDLYEEKWLKTANGDPKYDCRKVGPYSSIMNQHTSGQLSDDLFYLHNCSCSGPHCTQILKTIVGVPKACPKGTDHSSTLVSTLSSYEIATRPEQRELFEKYYQKFLGGAWKDPYRYSYLVQEKGPNKMLFPAEFRMITAPGCVAQNKVYYECASNAYRTKATPLGCAPTSSICDDPQLWLQ